MVHLSLLGGWDLSHLNRRLNLLLVSVYILAGLLPGGLTQLFIHNFVANSKAVIAFAKAHIESMVIASTSLHRVNDALKAFAPEKSVPASMLNPFENADCSIDDGTQAVYIVFDEETKNWGESAGYYADFKRKLMSHIRPVATLTPVGYGIGKFMAQGLVAFFEQLPESPLTEKARQIIGSYQMPKPATVHICKNGA